MHLRVAVAVAATTIAAAALPVGPGAAAANAPKRSHPDTIDLPAGFSGEGVAVGAGTTFYAGSTVDGRVARGDLRAGSMGVFVSAPTVHGAFGLKADLRHGLLWVAGGPTGQAAVYDLGTGDGVEVLTLTTAASFINDVIVTRDAAYFTNSSAAELYRVPVSEHGVVGEPQTIALHGPAGAVVAGAFNSNGIAATPDGRTLFIVNSAKGELYNVDPKTGNSVLIDLGGASVPTGDGILLSGRTLFVLQNGTVPGVANEIVVIRLRHDLTAGRVVDTITSPLFETATTLAKRGDILVAVNAQFAGAPIDPESEVVLLDLHQ